MVTTSSCPRPSEFDNPSVCLMSKACAFAHLANTLDVVKYVALTSAGLVNLHLVTIDDISWRHIAYSFYAKTKEFQKYAPIAKKTRGLRIEVRSLERFIRIAAEACADGGTVWQGSRPSDRNSPTISK